MSSLVAMLPELRCLYWVRAGGSVLEPLIKDSRRGYSSEKEDRRQRVATRSDLLGRGHLGQVYAGTSIEDRGPQDVEGWGLRGP